MRCVLLLLMTFTLAQAACSKNPITMWHPVSKKSVQCADEQCALRYEAAGYMRLTEKAK